MSNIKISDLGQAGALTGTELLPIVQNNETVRTTLNQVKSFSAPVISNNIVADAASTTKVPSVNAIKSYTDGLVVGLLNDRGNYTPSVSSPGAYPSSGGSGTGGAIQKGDIWFINGNGFLGTTAVVIGASVRALVSSPSPTTDSDWDILDAGLIQATLQSVLNNGNTALNQSIELDSATSYTYLDTNSLYIQENSDEGYYSATDTYVYDASNGNYIESYVSNPIPLLDIYRDSTGTSLQVSDTSIQFNNSGFGASLISNTLTSGQAWTLPNATGTLALTNNVWNATGNVSTVAGTNFIGTTDAIDFVTKTNNTERLRILSTGQVKLSSLTGTGTRMVVANATGQLATQTITSPTLQTVTNAGNTTTNDIISSSISSSITAQSSYDSASATLNAIGGESGYLILTTSTGLTSTLSPAILTGSRTYFLPDNDGTIALLSDINPGNTWNVVGNAGTIAGTNFIGTTDAIDLVTKTNNVERVRILSTGEATITNLAGSGTRMVVADSTGQLSTQAISSPTLQTITSGTNKNLTNGVNLQGTNAGGGTFGGTNINAFGTSAASSNSGSHVNALGNTAGTSNSGSYVNFIGIAGAFNTGSYVDALGYQAGQNNEGSYISALGYYAADNNTANYVNAIGYGAGGSNEGQYVNAIGYQAGANNVDIHLNALGYQAGQNNEGQYVNALGYQAGQNNTGSNVNAIGYGSGIGNTINGATIISNSTLPSYADYTAASAAITVGAGGTAGCTYLYHDQATNSIGAVRL
jgi:hypothetical protein